MKMLILAQFCCGCSVKTGAIIVGVFDLIMSIGNLPLYYYETDVEEGMLAYTKELMIFDAVVNIFSIIVSVTMVYGVLKQGKLQFMMPWLFFYLVYIPVFTLMATTLAVYYLTASHVALGLSTLAYMLFELVFLLYGYMIVYSHYRNVEYQLQLPPTPIYFLV